MAANSKTRLGWAGLALGLSMVVGGVMLRSAEAAPSIAEVTFLAGQAEQRATGDWKAMSVGSKVNEGTRLRTLADSRLETKLADGSLLRLGPSSEVTLERFKVDKAKGQKKANVRLFIGRLWASVTKLVGSESSFEVSTANAVAGVRGTRFEAAQDSGGNTTVKVYDGRVLISNQPIYAVKGATKAKRVQVAGPAEISKKQWTELVASAMQLVTVSATGDMSAAETFAAADPKADDWEAWNAERDKQAGLLEP